MAEVNGVRRRGRPRRRWRDEIGECVRRRGFNVHWRESSSKCQWWEYAKRVMK